MMLSSWILYGWVSGAVVLLLLLISAMFSMGEYASHSPEVYECGIEPLAESKIPFGMHFFNVGVLFLLFDVELVVCIPLVGMMVSSMVWKSVIIVVFEVLFIGLVVEVVVGSLDWKE